MARRTVITGLGFITSIGNDWRSVAESLRTLRHGFETFNFFGNPEVPVKVVGTIKGFSFPTPSWRDWRWPSEFEISRECLRGLAPHGLYAACALDQALSDAGLDAEEIADPGTGLFCASAGSPLMTAHHLRELSAARGMRGNPLAVTSSIAGTLNITLAARHHITGAVCGFASACASSSHAIGYAMDEIMLGRQNRMLIVGAEDVSAEGILPFAGLRALSINPDPETASRPFDQRRDGFVATGGATALVLEEESIARSRGARIYAELAGWGQASDGHSPTAPHPEGAGLVEAMRRSLLSAGIRPEEVDYINAHATSTLAGDRAEALALKSVFGGTPRPWISSTKALTGHGLSMSGAMESAFSALAIHEGFIPGAAHLEQPDPVCAGLSLPITTLEECPRVILNNGSGFGGSNVCHLLRRFN